MSIPESFFDELRSRVTLSTIIQQTTPLKKAGREWKACCPFHQEKSPSFTVNDEKGFYHCFGCSAHGDVIRWMTDQRGLGFLDAVKELAARAGLEVPAPDPRTAARQAKRDDAIAIMEKAEKLFANNLGAGHDKVAADYLVSRGISPKLARQFGIGWAPTTRRGDVPTVARLAPPSDLVQFGLLKEKEGARYDFFRGRIMIPIHDQRGRTIAFGGRALGDAQPKYLNSPDTPIFDKGRTLFNYHRAAPKARATGRLIIVEGYMDVIGLTAAGLEEAVAPNGTALTDNQLALAWKLVDEPIVCMDGDKAGRAAALRIAKRVLPGIEPGKSLHFAFPTDDRDPDDVAKDGIDAVNAMLAGAVPIHDVIWQDCLAQMKGGGVTAYTRVRAETRNLIASIRDQDVQVAMLDLFGRRFAEYEGRGSNLRKPQRSPARVAVNTAVQDAIVAGLLKYPDMADRHAEALVKIRFQDERNARVVDAVISIGEDHRLSSEDDWEIHYARWGISGDVLAIRERQVLQFPFLKERDPDKARRQLAAAIISTANGAK